MVDGELSAGVLFCVGPIMAVAVLITGYIFYRIIHFVSACDKDEPETMADYTKRFAEAERLHKARVERIQKQMDETRRHMEEW